MNEKGYFQLFILFLLHSSGTVLCQSNSLVLKPEGPISLSPGHSVTITCTANGENNGPLDWYHQGLDDPGFKKLVSIQDRVILKWEDVKTLSLTIEGATHQDSGQYLCRSNQSTSFVILAVQTTLPEDQCADTQYRCPDGRCIFQRYRCDAVTDCTDGADEEGCDRSCVGMFRCDNGQCINTEYVCDKFHSEDCRDGSDERDCGRIKYGEDKEDDPGCGAVGNGGHHEHRFHFNAIYTGVASVVGVACVGAIVVITLCRVHMKRESTRRRRSLYTSLALASPQNALQNGGTHGQPAIPNPPWRHRIPTQVSSNNHHHRGRLENESLEDNNSRTTICPHRCRGQTDLTLAAGCGGGNLQVSSDGVPLIENSIVKPPPYCERGPPPAIEEDEEPPPPYTTLPYPQGNESEERDSYPQRENGENCLEGNMETERDKPQNQIKEENNV